MMIYGCFLKWWYPQNTPKWSFLVGKPIVVGYYHFMKPLYVDPVLASIPKFFAKWWGQLRFFEPLIARRVYCWLWTMYRKCIALGILAHLLRMVMEPKYYAFWRWLDTPIISWEYDWMPRVKESSKFTTPKHHHERLQITKIQWLHCCTVALLLILYTLPKTNSKIAYEKRIKQAFAPPTKKTIIIF